MKRRNNCHSKDIRTFFGERRDRNGNDGDAEKENTDGTPTRAGNMEGNARCGKSPASQRVLGEQVTNRPKAVNVDSTVKKEVFNGQGTEKHEKPHNFSFCEPDKVPCFVSCMKPQTVLSALQSSEYFKSLLMVNTEKDIVIVREKPVHADVASHFPCCLIEKAENFIIKFNPGKTSDPESVKITTVPEKLVTLYVARIGGDNCKCKRFLKNMKNKDIPYLCIYAYVGETVMEALRRDGRFMEIVFEDGSELSCCGESLIVEICQKVDESLDGKKFKVNMKKARRSNPLDSGSEVADQEAVPEQGRGESTGGAETSEPGSEKSASAEPPTDVQRDSTPRAGESAHAKPTPVYYPLPDTEEMLEKLRSQFKGLVKHMKERKKVKGRKEVLDLLRVEFGKNIKVFWDVWKGKLLMEMSGSVCHIFNNNTGQQGSGFLLFGHYVLTNAHVIEGNISDVKIHVNFCHELRMEMALNLSVKGVVAQAYGWSDDGCYLDYALLELDENTVKDLPPPLLKWYCPSAEWGGICIVGHPEGEGKKFDLCSIIPFEQRESAVEKKKNIIQWLNWDFTIVGKDRNIITYDTCFYHGASGSPVFNADCHLFGMHTGGYFSDRSGNSVIEYAISLASILKDLLRKAVDSQNVDILTKFTEAASSQDSLHPLIADVITFIGEKESLDHWGCLQAIICAVESDVDSREHCWMNVVKSMSEVVRGGLRTWLCGVLSEAERNGLVLHQLLSGLSG